MNLSLLCVGGRSRLDRHGSDVTPWSSNMLRSQPVQLPGLPAAGTAGAGTVPYHFGRSVRCNLRGDNL